MFREMLYGATSGVVAVITYAGADVAQPEPAAVPLKVTLTTAAALLLMARIFGLVTAPITSVSFAAAEPVTVHVTVELVTVPAAVTTARVPALAPPTAIVGATVWSNS